jgi:hypothetical protein
MNLKLRRFIFVSLAAVLGVVLAVVLGIELCLRLGIIKKRYAWQGRRVIGDHGRLPISGSQTNNLTIRSSEPPSADAAGGRSP